MLIRFKFHNVWLHQMPYVFCLQLNFLRREFIGLYSSKMLNLKHLASHAYRQYELVTCVNMLEPWEKKLINGFFLVMLFLVLFSSFMYLPNYMQTLMQFVTPPNWHNSPDSAAYVAQKMTRS